jgi:hypothetical protein
MTLLRGPTLTTAHHTHDQAQAQFVMSVQTNKEKKPRHP